MHKYKIQLFRCLSASATKASDKKIMAEVDTILSQGGDRGQAVNLLTDAILQNPNDLALHKKLGEIALSTKNKKDPTNQEFEELSEYSQSLASFEAFVTTLEQRYQPSLKGADETQVYQLKQT